MSDADIREVTKPIENGANSERSRRWWNDLPPQSRARIWGVGIFLVCLAALFSRTLVQLAKAAFEVELHSHVVLIPFVSLYLLWIRREALFKNLRSAPLVAISVFAVAVATWALPRFFPSDPSDRLALEVLSFVIGVWGGGILLLGKQWFCRAVFPAAFLLFMIPLPDRVVDFLENASKLASAEAANLFFMLAGLPYIRDGARFSLPNINIEVAQQCSGIRSSYVLLITGVFAANLLLQTTWRRWALVLFMIPLGILRNGFRILVLALLCVHYSPTILDSVLHNRGGPIFFALSMIPLVGFVWWLRRGEVQLEARLSATNGARHPPPGAP